MTKKFVVVIILFSIVASTIPQSAFGLVIPDDIGTGSDVPSDGASLSCSGTWAKIICVIKKIADIIKVIKKLKNALSYVPHSFPFGGPILSSERACSFHMRSITWLGITYPFVGWLPTPIYVPIDVPLLGRAIVVGPPLPTYPEPTTSPRPGDPVPPPGGKIIAFPWISAIYKNHTENRAGPWALGLGFTPFPLKDINDAFDGIRIWIPSTSLDRDCLIPDPSWPYGKVGFLAECLDNFSFDCKASGEKDSQGNDIYKVIQKLGTSRDNAPASAFPPGFTLP